MSRNRTTKLKPCPFCGAEASWSNVLPTDNVPYQVGCSDNSGSGCKVRPYTDCFLTRDEAIKVWNGRVLSGEQVEALRTLAKVVTK